MCAKMYRFSEENRKDAKYEKFLWEIQTWVAHKSRVFRDEVMELAMLKAWKKWDEKQPTGAMIEFTDQMFLECADKNVGKLMNMIHAMEEFAGEDVMDEASHEDSEDLRSESTEASIPDSTDPSDFESTIPQDSKAGTFEKTDRSDRGTELSIMTAFSYSQSEDSYWVLCPEEEFEAKVLNWVPKDEKWLLDQTKEFYNTSNKDNGFHWYTDYRNCYSFMVSRKSGAVTMTHPGFNLPTLFIGFDKNFAPIDTTPLESLETLVGTGI